MNLELATGGSHESRFMQPHKEKFAPLRNDIFYVLVPSCAESGKGMFKCVIPKGLELPVSPEGVSLPKKFNWTHSRPWMLRDVPAPDLNIVKYVNRCEE